MQGKSSAAYNLAPSGEIGKKGRGKGPCTHFQLVTDEAHHCLLRACFQQMFELFHMSLIIQLASLPEASNFCTLQETCPTPDRPTFCAGPTRASSTVILSRELRGLISSSTTFHSAFPLLPDGDFRALSSSLSCYFRLHGFPGIYKLPEALTHKNWWCHAGLFSRLGLGRFRSQCHETSG